MRRVGLQLIWSGRVSLVFGLVGVIAVFAIVTGVMQIVLALELRLLRRG